MKDLGLNPLGIGEGFEPMWEHLRQYCFRGLNPLGIGEGFELKRWSSDVS